MCVLQTFSQHFLCVHRGHDVSQHVVVDIFVQRDERSRPAWDGRGPGRGAGRGDGRRDQTQRGGADHAAHGVHGTNAGVGKDLQPDTQFITKLIGIIIIFILELFLVPASAP